MRKLDRTLSLPAVVLFGITYMTPIIVLGTFGVLATITEGHVPMAYLLASMAMLFTALSYSKMAAKFPVSGSAYTYVRMGLNSKLGFIAGWVILLDYLFLPMVIWLIGGSFLYDAFPEIPLGAWVLIFIMVTTTINIVGLQLAKIVNAILMIIQTLIIFAFIGLAIHYTVTDGLSPLWSFNALWSNEAKLPLVIAGASVACYSFLGFDAVTTLADETKEPKKTIPKAIILTTLLGGGVFVITSYFIQTAHPSYIFENSDAAATQIAFNIGGDIFVSIFLIGLIVGQFASGVSAQTSASRLLYAMGKDGVFYQKLFGSLNTRYGTPHFNIIFCGVIAVIAIFVDVMTAASFINFGAFLAFMMVNIAVINYFWIQQKERSGKAVLGYLLFPLIGLISTFLLFLSLDKLALTLGGIWLIIGISYLAYITDLFKKDPPQLAFNEDVS